MKYSHLQTIRGGGYNGFYEWSDDDIDYMIMGASSDTVDGAKVNADKALAIVQECDHDFTAPVRVDNYTIESTCLKCRVSAREPHDSMPNPMW